MTDLQEALKHVRYNEMAHIQIDDEEVTLVPCLDKENGGIIWQRETNVLSRHLRTKAWIWPMLNDTWRNELYQKAIETVAKRLKTAPKVLDLGAGTGLLGMMVKRAMPQATVTAVEMSKAMATIAKQVTKDNGYDIDVVEMHSFEMKGSKSYNLCVSELLEDGLLGEGILPTLRDAWERHLTEDAIVIPSAARVFVQIVEGRELQDLYGPHVTEPCSLFLDAKNEQMMLNASDVSLPIRADKWIKDRRLTILSDPIPVLDFSFERGQIPSEDGRSRTIDCKIQGNGIVQGFLISWELDLLDGITYSMVPGKSKWQDHWHQTLQIIPTESYKTVKHNDVITIKVTHDDHCVKVQMVVDDSEPAEKVTRSQPAVPLISPFRAYQLNSESYLASLSRNLSALFRKDLILDISDFSLCAILAANHAAPKVVSVESSTGEVPLLSAKVAQLANRLPKTSTQFDIIQCAVENLTLDVIGGSPASLLCFEPYFEMLEGWHIEELLNSFFTVKALKEKGLTGDNTLFLPSKCQVIGQFLQSDQLRQAYQSSEIVAGFDHSFIEKSRNDGRPRLSLSLDLSDIEYEIASRQFTLSNFDFAEPSADSQSVNGIIFPEMKCDALVATVHYGSSKVLSNYWRRHAIYMVDPDERDAKNFSVQLHFDDNDPLENHQLEIKLA